jgi:hypothetical protein
VTHWPAATDYRDALQDPGHAFADPDLRAGQVEANWMGIPRVRAGFHSNVYKLTLGATARAVRVFLTPDAGRA